ncbi:MAG: PEGA domain-containing protein [Planctomycetota bacterium]
MSSSLRGPRSFALLGLVVCATTGCYTTNKIHVKSTPSGAKIFIDGSDSGEVTPAHLRLSAGEPSYELSLRKPGYNEVIREIKVERDVDFLTPKEAVCSVLCAPFCCGLPLLNFLTPVEVNVNFVPEEINAFLDPAGQGLRVATNPGDAKVFLDGQETYPNQGNLYMLEPGRHRLEVRAEGFRTYSQAVHVRKNNYESVVVELVISGQGLLLSGVPEGSEISIDGNYEGQLSESEQRLRLDPGLHDVRISSPGFDEWTRKIRVEPDAYTNLRVELRRSGQGIDVCMALDDDLAETVKILVNGSVVSTTLCEPIRLPPGAYLIGLEVEGYDRWEEDVRVSEGSYLEIEPKLERSED